MTEAKRKAEELIRKYQEFAHANALKESDLFYKELKKNTIECALICVEEIIKSNPHGYSIVDNRYWQGIDNQYFWEEVRDELNKMK